MSHLSHVILFLLLIFPLSMAAAGVVAGSGGQRPATGPPQPVASVDLQRYAGQWYEIAKIPNRFQRKCASGTTAEYTVREDGMIGVVNRCIEADGSVSEASGVARVVDAASGAKLEVSFVRFLGLQLFWGDYWVIGLQPEYRWAVVGHPDRRYGWVLARSAALTSEEWSEIQAVLRGQGYDPDDFEMTTQAVSASPEAAGR